MVDEKLRTLMARSEPRRIRQESMMLPVAQWRRVLLIAVFAVTSMISTGARANDYPDRAIRIISMHPPGSVTDVLARPLAQKLNTSLKQPVIVENRPGANGIIATSAVAKAPPDGYTILITSGSHIANAHLGNKLPYDPIKDFAPITQLSASYGLALITKLPVNSVAELVALGKKKQLSYAINGAGNVTHIAGLLLERMADIKMVPVPYNQSTLATDVIAGNVDFAFFAVSLSAPLVNEKQVKALAVTGERRSPALPDAPTMQELGYKDFDVTGYFCLLMPANTPADRVELIHRESKNALASPELRNVIERGGQYVVGSSPTELLAFLKKDFQYQDRLMDELGLKSK
jgi:tripartite-type tricarboxylate transporter receptor subunit TctC